MPQTIEQHRISELARYHRRRNNAIQTLGGKCVVCGTTENLELDHIDPKTKSFGISQMWSVRLERFQKELGKCQLLCKKHHVEKTKNDSTYTETHSYTRYMNKKYKCRCDVCKAEYSKWRKNRYAKNKV